MISQPFRLVSRPLRLQSCYQNRTTNELLLILASVAPVRSLLGVSKLDRLPKEELVTVSYISRMTNNKNEMIYYMVKEVDHTRDSFPATMAEPKDLTHDLRLLYIPKMKGGHPTRIRGPATIPEPGLRSNRLALMIIWGSLGLAAAATSFPVVCVSSAWTWSRVLATFGMFFGLAISSIMWSYVYVVEQIPSPMPGLTSSKSVNSDTHSFKIAEFRNSSGSSESSIPARTSPKRAADYENFAVIRPEKRSKQLIFCNLETVSGKKLQICRIVSLLSAVLISVG